MSLLSQAEKSPTLLVTGGYGFIGSAFIRLALARDPKLHVLNLDALTYAGNPANLNKLSAQQARRHHFVKGDIRNRGTIRKLLTGEVAGLVPQAVVNFAAESHVDRSILGPMPFVKTNVEGTQALLWEAHNAWKNHDPDHSFFRFLHVGTDEVYGTLGKSGKFHETTPLKPNSPYSASKAGADFLVRAAHETHGLFTLTSRCCNNYGPYQFPEKLIPLMISRAMANQPLPVYGDGLNVRDWIEGSDHAEGLWLILQKGRAGRVYNVSAHQERNNLQVVRQILSLLGKGEDMIQFVKDRPGHDRRYALDATRLMTELGYRPRHDFETGLAATVDWYKKNRTWVKAVTDGSYRGFVQKKYAKRLSAK